MEEQMRPPPLANDLSNGPTARRAATRARAAGPGSPAGAGSSTRTATATSAGSRATAASAATARGGRGALQKDAALHRGRGHELLLQRAHLPRLIGVLETTLL